MLTVSQYRDRIRRRAYRTLDYVSIAFSVLLIYSAFLVADTLLINLVEYLFRAEIVGWPFIATIFKYIKVGLAMLAFILAVVHGVRSALDQYQLDARLAREDKKPHV